MSVTRALLTPNVNNTTELSIPNVPGALFYNIEHDRLSYNDNSNVVQRLTNSVDLSNLDATVVHNTGDETIAGVKTFTSNIVGNISGNSGTVTDGVYTTDIGTVTNAMLAGSISASKLIQTDIVLAESQVTNLTSDLASKLNLSGGTMTGNLILNTDPTSSSQAATKNYVDMIAAGFNQFAVSAASTTNLIGIYNNGSSGVGATFTITATGAFTLDGQAGVLNASYLLKDQSSSFQNGIYTLTTVGGLLTQPVLTRSIDYDTPSEIGPGDIVNVANGTTNAGISYLQTATVTTIGTDAITFSRWGGQSMTFVGNVTGSGFSPVTLTIGSQQVINSMIANGTIDLTAKVTGTLPNANTTAVSTNTNSAIVTRDSAGAFSAGIVSVTGLQSTGQVLSTKTGSLTNINNSAFLGKGTTPAISLWDTSSGSYGTIIAQDGDFTKFITAPYTPGAGWVWAQYTASSGQIDILANQAPGGINGGIATIYGGQAGNSGQGGHIQLIAGSSGTSSLAGNVYIRGGIATSGQNGNVYFDQGFVVIDSITASSLVFCGATNGLQAAIMGTHLSLSVGGTLSTDAASTNTASTIVSRDSSGNFSAGTITATISGTATNATNIAITNDTSTNATMYPVWVTANTGNLPAKVSSTKMSFNPSTGILSTTGLNLSGLTASYAVVMDGSNNLASLQYTASNIASTLIARTSSGSFDCGNIGVTGSITVTDLAVPSIFITATRTGFTSIPLLQLDRADQANGVCRIDFSTANLDKWYLQMINGSTNINFHDVVNNVDVISIVAGSGTSSKVTFAGGVNIGGLTASRVVGTDGSSNLTTLTYASANTASALVQRDSNGAFSMGALNCYDSGVSTNGTSAVILVNGAGSTTNAGSTANFSSGNSSTAGKIYGIAVEKFGTEVLYMGVNKNTTTDSIPVNTCFISTYSNTGKMAIGRGGSNSLPSTADILLNGDGSVTFAGSIGIGVTPINGTLTFNNATASPFPRCILYSVANNDHQYLGFGISSATLRYQVPDNLTSHIFYAGSSSSASTQLFKITGKGSVVCNSAAIATNATDGFLYVPSCAGTPTGTPTTNTGSIATVYDTSANKIWFYNGSWRGVAVT